MAKFRVFKSTKDSQYYFNLRDNSGNLLLRSEGYTTRQNCLLGVASVKRNSPYDSNYQRYHTEKWGYYFTLTAPENGQTLGVSMSYVYEFQRKAVITVMRAEAQDATVQDDTTARGW